jgi:hypothetical protein
MAKSTSHKPARHGRRLAPDLGVEVTPIPFKFQEGKYLFSISVNLKCDGGTVSDYGALAAWPTTIGNLLAAGGISLRLSGGGVTETFIAKPAEHPAGDVILALSPFWQTLAIDGNRPAGAKQRALAAIATVTEQFDPLGEALATEMEEYYSQLLVKDAGVATSSAPRIFTARSADWLKEIEHFKAILKGQNDYFQGHLKKASALAAAGEHLFEFQNLISGLREYPTLMRAFGLIIDCYFELDRNVPADGALEIVVNNVPAGMSFSSNAVYYSLQQNASFECRTKPDTLIYERFLVMNHQMPGKEKKLLDTFYVHQLDPVATGYAIYDDLKAGNPDFKPVFSQGMMLSRRNSSDELDLLMARAAADPFYLDDLVMGYCVDILPARDTQWRSLNRRVVSYCITDATGKPQTSKIDFEDEGFISENASKAILENVERLVMGDTFVHWDGWSLAVPRLEEDKTYEQPASDPTKAPYNRLSSEKKVVEKSLPVYRYGNEYKVRVRVVDLCGNGKAFSDMEHSPVVVKDFSCYRSEPVTSPNVRAPYSLKQSNNPYNDVDKCINGESNSIVCVRSREGISGSNQNPYSFRYIVPPKVEQKLAERLGMFDPIGQDIARKKDWVIRSLTDLGEPTTPYDPGREAFTYEKMWFEYLPDPCVAGFNVKVLRHPDDIDPVDIEQRLKIFFKQTGAGVWPNWAKWGILLRPGKHNEMTGPHTTPVCHIIFDLREGEELTFDLHSFVKEEMLDVFGLAGRIRDPQARQKVVTSIKEGINPRIAPPTRLTLIHAVEKPLFPATINNINIAPPRSNGETGARLSCRFNFPGKTSNKLELHAEWREVDDVPGQPIKTVLLKEAIRQFELKDPAGVEIDKDGEITLPATHDFHDTKYRNVLYHTTATSRFQAFFPAETDSGPRDFTRASPAVGLKVPSTENPAPLEVIDVIPLYRDVPSLYATKKFTSIRLLFKRGSMFDQGEGMKVAFVCMKAGTIDDYIGSPHYTVAGRDAIMATGIDRLIVPEDFENRFNKDTKVESKLSEPGNSPVTLALYEPQLDLKRDVWYVDVQLAGDVLDTLSFIKFSVAKYQAEAIDGKVLSLTTQTFFIQLESKREVVVTQQTDNFSLVVHDTTAVDAQTPYQKEVVCVAQFNDEPDQLQDSLMWRPAKCKIDGNDAVAFKLDFNGGTKTWEKKKFQINGFWDNENVRLLFLEYQIFERSECAGPNPDELYKEDVNTLESANKQLKAIHSVILKQN